ncbi:4'-phosphopantetheinyl transferase superfamily protein [Dechloromonas sp. TW-R-39-2]|uniref:4'-phosphopantetheinyl transferase superfamily protein n=1 Tax=Dechloromonas sp. TW-R-39-2 TaxID=2654218 RepID=UPI00193D3233|nr:4'-phosphopantetheinyl transferase superfamily protein [Dechloromonas sp. TW-R-39-2]QRM18361.1 4'-phosphopantetheinyl transferase superfamily protein [Dechloromonas sp. TW-R-39-2]
MRAPPIHHWPACAGQAIRHEGLIVIAVDTPETPIRDTARQRLRQALSEVLAEQGIDHRLIAEAGRPLRLERHPEIGLSCTHEPGLSLVAIHFNGPVGIDLMRLDAGLPDTTEIRQLASDYLGPGMAQRLLADPQAFAATWTAHEASLKCLGLALEEWTPALAERLAQCHCMQLALPASHVGTLCVRPAWMRA